MYESEYKKAYTEQPYSARGPILPQAWLTNQKNSQTSKVAGDTEYKESYFSYPIERVNPIIPKSSEMLMSSGTNDYQTTTNADFTQHEIEVPHRHQYPKYVVPHDSFEATTSYNEVGFYRVQCLFYEYLTKW